MTIKLIQLAHQARKHLLSMQKKTFCFDKNKLRAGNI